MVRDREWPGKDLRHELDQSFGAVPAEYHIKQPRKNMEFLIPVAIVVAWFVLQAWVLPRFGVKT
ncbi:MAG TPA: hypothetical protein VHC22_27690 [Pirellulales bacterium]|nr:hypothetical protein [Pirellulales bacterium]